MLFRKNGNLFEDIVMKEVDSLYRFALRLTGNATRAEDLVQETLLRAYRGFDHFEFRDGRIKPWLFKILHHIFFDDLALQKRRHEIRDEPIWDLLADHHPGEWLAADLEHLDWEQFDEEIKKGIETLSPEYRIILLLWSLEQMSYREIAEICNIPVGTVMSRLFRARKELSGRLAGYARTHHLEYASRPEPFNPDKRIKFTVLKGF
jgi:RNA polymerase sigma-70 factor (ECF subfamily)